MFDLKLYQEPQEMEVEDGRAYLLFCTEEYLDQWPELVAPFRRARMYGVVVPYLISGDRLIERGLALLGLTSGKSRVVSCSMTDSPDALARALDGGPGGTMLLFVDGLSPRLEAFVTALNQAVGDRDCRVLGTGVGYKDLRRAITFFTPEGMCRDTALMVLTDMSLSVGVRHGWRSIYGPWVVTRVRGNVLYELNGRPAFQVYAQALEELEGRRVQREGFFQVAKSYPFGITEFLDGEIIVRDPIAVTEEDALVLVTSVQEMDTLYLMKGEPEELIASSRRLAEETFASGGEVAFVFDCISRVLFLDREFTREIQTIHAAAKGAGLPLFGLTSIGELTNTGQGGIRIFNKTVLLGVLGDD